MSINSISLRISTRMAGLIHTSSPPKLSRSISFKAFGGSDRDVNLKNKNIVIVAGGSGDLGSQIVKKACRQGSDSSVQVFATSRQSDHRGLIESPNLSWLTLPKKSGEQSLFWKNFFNEINTSFSKKEGSDSSEQSAAAQLAASNPLKIVVVNAIGGAHPKNGETLYSINYLPAEALFLAFAEAQFESRKKTAIQISSLAEKVVPIQAGNAEKDVDPFNEYGRIKRITSLFLKNIPDEMLPNMTIFLVGYVLPTLLKSEASLDFSKEHGYDVAQIANMAFQMIIGDGQQQMQPICKEDLIEGIVKSFDLEGRQIIPAVGEQVVTQEEMVKSYCDLLGKPMRAVHVPIKGDALLRLGQLAHEGHFAPYAVLYLQTKGISIDPTAFSALLGRPARGVEAHTLDSEDQDKPFAIAQSPFIEHSQRVIKQMRADPAFRKEVLSAVKDLAKEYLS